MRFASRFRSEAPAETTIDEIATLDGEGNVLTQRFTMTFPDGSYAIYHYKNDVLHRDGDLPAIITSEGTMEFYKEGKLHRDGDLPAYSSLNVMIWVENGNRHRGGGLPAFIRADGRTQHYENGELHREGGLPAVFHASEGIAEHFIRGERVA